MREKTVTWGSDTGPANGFLRDLWPLCFSLCEKLDEMLKVLSIFILTCCRNPAALRAVVAERGFGPCLPGQPRENQHQEGPALYPATELPQKFAHLTSIWGVGHPGD